MSFFKTTLEIQDFLPVNATFEFKGISPFLRQAERDYIIPVLGAAQYNDLHSKYQAGTALTSIESELLLNIRVALAPLAYMLWIPFGQVKIDSSGIRIVTTESMKTAFQWQIQDLEGSAMRTGFSGIEALYEFLELNKESFSLWTGSTSYTESKELFINTAKALTEAVDMPCTRRTYIMVRPILKKLQQTLIKNTLGVTLYAEIREQILDDSLTEENEELLTLIQPAVGNLAMATAVKKLAVVFDQYGFNILATSTIEKGRNPAKDSDMSVLEAKFREDGNNYLTQLQDKVNEDNDDYDNTIDNDPDNGVGFF